MIDGVIIVEVVEPGLVETVEIGVPGGDSGPGGSVEPVANTLVQRDGAAGIYAAGITAGAITGAPSAPVVSRSLFVAADGGTLDSTKTFYYRLQVIMPDIRSYAFPEEAVPMNGHTAASASLLSRPVLNGVEAGYVMVHRTEEPGNYGDPYGVVYIHAFSGSETYPLEILDTGLPVQGQNPIINTTSEWSAGDGGIVHRGQIIAGKATVMNAVPDDANDGTLVPASWVKGRIAENARVEASIHAEFVNIEVGQQCDIVMPYNATITDLLLIGDAVGSAALSIWRKSLAVPTAADTIGTVNMTDAAFVHINGTTGLTSTALVAGDVLRINIDSVSGLGRVTLMLMVDKA